MKREETHESDRSWGLGKVKEMKERKKMHSGEGK